VKPTNSSATKRFTQLRVSTHNASNTTPSRPAVAQTVHVNLPPPHYKPSRSLTPWSLQPAQQQQGKASGVNCVRHGLWYQPSTGHIHRPPAGYLAVGRDDPGNAASAIAICCWSSTVRRTVHYC